MRGHGKNWRSFTPSLPRGIDVANRIRESRVRPEAEPGAASAPVDGVPRRQSGNRRKDWQQRASVGAEQRDTSGAFELDMQTTPVQRMDAVDAVGNTARSSSRRTLLRSAALPLPPTINAIYATRIVTAKGTGKPIAITYTSNDYKAYSSEIRDRLLELKAWFRSEHPLELCILVCPRDRRRQDISNRIKTLEDALKDGHLFVDDDQVKVLEVREGPIIKQGMAKVTVREILHDAAANLRWIEER